MCMLTDYTVMVKNCFASQQPAVSVLKLGKKQDVTTPVTIQLISFCLEIWDQVLQRQLRE